MMSDVSRTVARSLNLKETTCPPPQRIGLTPPPSPAAGKPPAPVEGLTQYKLSSNENPLGPVPEVACVLAEFATAHRYPDPLSTALRHKLSARLGVDADDIVTGAGSLGALNQILKTMPLNKRFKRPEEYLEEVGITAPTMIFEKNSDGETLASWGIGNFLNPVQFIWAGLDDDAPKGVVTPNYESELQKGAEKIRTGYLMEPPADFDWQNLLPGCRPIPKYEWDYLFGKWQDTHKGKES